MSSHSHQFFNPAADQAKDLPKTPALHASGQDAANNFPGNQDGWIAFSEEVLDEIVRNIGDNGHFFITEAAQRSGPQNASDFENIFRFCAKKRYEIAQTLNHENARHFGVFRGKDEWIWEELYGDPAYGGWANVKSEVFKDVLSLASNMLRDIAAEEAGFELVSHSIEEPFELISSPLDEDAEEAEEDDEACETMLVLESSLEDEGLTVSKEHEDEFMKIFCEKYQKDLTGEEFVINIQLKTASFESGVTKAAHYNKELSDIIMRHYPQDTKKDFVRITHAKTSEDEQVGNFNIANHYYKNLLSMSTDSAEDRNEFLKELGRLTYLLAHLMPLRRGSSSVCEWITKAIALKKGITLGAFNHDEPLPWDFKAFVTPDQEVYAAWYAEKAFLDITLESELPPRVDGP